ncbi:MAG: DUF1989 domain-containing protein, partial [Hyphomicrobiaceae bacterium]
MLDVVAEETGYPDVIPGPPKPSVILNRSGPALPPGIERYVVPGGGTAILALAGGDTLTVTDLEGGQPCEILVADKKGKTDPAILGRKGNCDLKGMQATLESKAESAHITRRALTRRKIDLGRARGIRVFSAKSPPRNSATFTVARPATLVVCAPGGRMKADVQNTSTPVEVLIRRTRISAKTDIALPEPLARPLQEIRVRRATAEAFFVNAGDYIQILDVSGRQMTDFQCFSARQLDKGNEYALDATITRTLSHLAYPKPGIPSKAFALDMEPLVEVVRDTCGRHDFYATACNSRYYDDMGYPGHVNCTANFNSAIDEYSITPREGWEALNFFYNTWIDDDHCLYADESWSRPGDYVLLKALTDLVCVSSACPDDIDPGNGWDPTDIHVRTYAEKNAFSRAIAFRMTSDADPQLTKETGFHECFKRHTRNFTEYNGYWLPANFNDGCATNDYWACRKDAAVMDLSPLRKFEVTGPDAEALLQYCLTRNVRKLAAGQVVYTAMCYEHGGMIDDGTLYRLDTNNFRWVGGSDYGGIWLREQAEKLGLKVWVRSSTDQLHNIAVQGPKSRDILKEVIWTAPAQPTTEELGWFRFTPARIGGFKGIPIVLSRTGYTGELGYEIYCHPDDAVGIFDAVWEAGEPHGLKPLGLDALDMVRIEAGLIFAGYEFCDQTDPFEAGIGFTVPLKSKEDDFIGRDALIRRKENPVRKLVGLEIDANVDVGHGDCVHIGRAQIGEVTSGMRSPILKKNIALARLDVTHTAIGTEVEIGKMDGH